MKTLLMFPGQGSQYIGMGANIYQNYTSSKEVFRLVDEVLKYDLSNLIFSGNEDDLKKSQYTQPALMTVSTAIFVAIKEEYKNLLDNLNIQGVIGHSVGEYSALCATGSISLKDAALILQKRGNLMYECSGVNTGMCAIIGCDKLTIQETINEIEPQCLVIANNNSASQIVVSGYLQDINKLIQKLQNVAKKMILLPVSGAFHSPLMQKAEENLKLELNNLTINAPKYPILQNYSCQFESDADKIKQNLMKQITSPVLWYESIQLAINNGFDTFIEIGAKNVLSGLVKRSVSNEKLQTIKILNIETTNDIKNLSLLLNNE